MHGGVCRDVARPTACAVDAPGQRSFCFTLSSRHPLHSGYDVAEFHATDHPIQTDGDIKSHGTARHDERRSLSVGRTQWFRLRLRHNRGHHCAHTPQPAECQIDQIVIYVNKIETHIVHRRGNDGLGMSTFPDER